MAAPPDRTVMSARTETTLPADYQPMCARLGQGQGGEPLELGWPNLLPVLAAAVPAADEVLRLALVELEARGDAEAAARVLGELDITDPLARFVARQVALQLRKASSG